MEHLWNNHVFGIKYILNNEKFPNIIDTLLRYEKKLYAS